MAEWLSLLGTVVVKNHIVLNKIDRVSDHDKKLRRGLRFTSPIFLSSAIIKVNLKKYKNKIKRIKMIKNLKSTFKYLVDGPADLKFFAVLSLIIIFGLIAYCIFGSGPNTPSAITPPP